MNTLEYLQKRYNLNFNDRLPLTVAANRLEELPIIFRELGFKKGVEVGVLEGNFSEILCKELPDTIIYSVDPWKWYPIYHNFRHSSVYEPMYQRVKDRLSKYSNSVIIRKESMDAIKEFEDESLDFVFIDADHRFQFIAWDIAEWSKKVRPGGLIISHDFAKTKSGFVDTYWVVHAWCAARRISPWFVLNHPWETTALWVKE